MLWDKWFYITFDNVTKFVKGLKDGKILKAFFPEEYSEPSQTSNKEHFAKTSHMFKWVLNMALYFEM